MVDTVVFASDRFACSGLEWLLARHRVLAVVTQAPKLGDRRRLTPTDIDRYLQNCGAKVPVIHVNCPQDLVSDQRITDFLQQADLGVVISFGLKLPEAILGLPRQGCINVHPSLLPRWRGAAPLEAALAAGDRQTGVVVQQVSAIIDAGGIWLQEPIAISENFTAEDLRQSISQRLPRLLAATFRAIESGQTPQPQDPRGVTYAPRLKKEQSWVRWTEPAHLIARRLRSHQHQFAARTYCERELIMIIKAKGWLPWQIGTNIAPRRPGTTETLTPLRVWTGYGLLELQTLQRPGKSAVSARSFVHGRAGPQASGRASGQGRDQARGQASGQARWRWHSTLDELKQSNKQSDEENQS